MSLLTNIFAIPSASWTDLGAGPLKVAARGPEWVDVVMALSDARLPDALTSGESLRGSRFFGGTTHVWAFAPAGPVSLVVTPPDVRAGGGASSGGGQGFRASDLSPVTGAFTAGGQSAAFAPLAGRGFNVSLWGTFGGAVQLERSFDQGTTWLPITAAGQSLYAFTGPASESAQDDEAGVLYRLNCTSLVSGTANYRVSQ